MTLAWFVFWFIANNIGDHEPLVFWPHVNGWAGALLFCIAVDLVRS